MTASDWFYGFKHLLGGAPHLQKIVEWFIADANTAYAKYLTGDIDQLTVPLANVDGSTSTRARR